MNETSHFERKEQSSNEWDRRADRVVPANEIVYGEVDAKEITR